ncbi:NAD(P)/FAD-dependent oxidoreductase [Aestuariirhabdus litorea]|uniref:NAD(P)/FAD-dependent oxidoreductase n=1 Tax=Aestuariirhabdus litorea TaxID=2528527 RepID=A0A3P3VQP5_9GAMM|nr:FAD-dependent oxidoreductase [Aestuariirhabdus litorea]RRJ83976.1 NAD(P)/FAD-dependent oxidoreductase [Aestuariirhabdus litorea]RWW97196.1 NAD(P)/FAD-dependent oxidoreductase [Endozoicomonadaceae bacterium GTF-13]
MQAPGSRSPARQGERPRLVVIGNGMAATRTLDELLAIAPDHYRITLLGREPGPAYNRILLSPLLAGEIELEQIRLHDRDWYHQQGIELLTGTGYQVTRIDRHRCRVQCANGQQIHYDRLLIATGSLPALPELEGLSPGGNPLKGVLGFRDLADVEQMTQAARAGNEAVVIGGGLLGLEAAHGLNCLGMRVTLVHRAPYLLNRQLDPEAAALLQRELESRGIRFVLAGRSRAVRHHTDADGADKVAALELEDGQRLAADLLVVTTGIRPNIELAAACGLACRQGVLVNDCLQTYDPRIYAVGECVEHRGLTFGLVEPLFQQARVCANQLAGIGTGRYRFTPPPTRLKVSGIQLFSLGELEPAATDSPPQALVYRDPAGGIYRKLLLRDNRLVGAVLYGEVADGPWYFELMRTGQDLSALRAQLIFGQACCERLQRTRPPVTAEEAA